MDLNLEEIPDGWTISRESSDTSQSDEYKYEYIGGEITTSINKITQNEYSIIFWHNNTVAEVTTEDLSSAQDIVQEHMKEISQVASPYLYFEEYLLS